MKIKGTCKRCGRDVFAEQIVAAGGACPWDGEPFNPITPSCSSRRCARPRPPARDSRPRCEEIAALRPAFTIEASSVLGKLQAAIAGLSREPHHPGVAIRDGLQRDAAGQDQAGRPVVPAGGGDRDRGAAAWAFFGVTCPIADLARVEFCYLTTPGRRQRGARIGSRSGSSRTTDGAYLLSDSEGRTGTGTSSRSRGSTLEIAGERRDTTARPVGCDRPGERRRAPRDGREVPAGLDGEDLREWSRQRVARAGGLAAGEVRRARGRPRAPDRR